VLRESRPGIRKIPAGKGDCNGLNFIPGTGMILVFLQDNEAFLIPGSISWRRPGIPDMIKYFTCHGI
jgi:hypothetical protein